MNTRFLGVLAAGCLAAACAQAATPAPMRAEPDALPTTAPDLTPVVAGAGAIAGVVAFNLFGLGLVAIPGAGAYAAGATVPAEMSVAMSRIYATSSAVVGALLADYLYTR